MAQRYSSAQVTSRQLAISVDQGLASTEDSESFEAVQRRLMAKVQEEMAAAKATQGTRTLAWSGTIIGAFAASCSARVFNENLESE